MEIVSDKVKELLGRQFRNPCHFKVILGVIEPTAVDESSLTANNNAYFSSLEPIELGQQVLAQYGTLEDYFTPLNDAKELPREVWEPQVYQGYVSEAMSDESCTYGKIPTVTITTDTPIRVAGLTMGFDIINKDYPTELRITAYLSDSLVDQLNVNPDSWQYVVNHPFEYFDKLTIEFLKSNVPYRRARFTSIIYGVSRVYDTSNRHNISNLISAKEEREISMVNKTLPTFNVSFSINNISKEFDIDNPQGIDKYLVANQPATYYWGIEDDAGEVQWILGGNVLTDGTLKADSTQLTLSCTDKLTKLNDTFIKGLYRASGISLYDLAVEVLADAGVSAEDYVLDSNLKNITTFAPLPATTHKACLQLIAAAGLCILYTNRLGQICIIQAPTTIENYYLDLNMAIDEAPATTMIQKMKNMKSYYHAFSIESSSSQIGAMDTNLKGTETLQIQYEAATSVVATVTGGTLNSAVYYTKYCELSITATGPVSIKINGKKLVTTQTLVEQTFDVTGKTAEIENPLICSYEHCIQYMEYVANAIENRHVYEGQFRGDPTLDVGDKVTAETKFSSSVPSTLTKLTIDYKGSFDGNVKFTKVEK